MKYLHATLLVLSSAVSAPAGWCQCPTQRHEYLPPGPVDDIGFGFDADVGGSRVAFTAPFSDESGPLSGSAYVFDLVSGSLLQTLTAEDASAGDLFGWSCAMAGDRILIGAQRDSSAALDAGSAYLFDVHTGVQLLKLVPSSSESGLRMGADVALSQDYAVVGAPGDFTVQDSGSVFVYDAQTGEELMRLRPSDSSIFGSFGTSLAIEGTTLAVGNSSDDTNGQDAGAVYLFDLTTGTELAKLLASDGEADDRFGSELAMDQGILLASAPSTLFFSSQPGSAYLFDVATGTELAILTSADSSQGDSFGASVSLDSGRAFVGATAQQLPGGAYGAAYLFDVTNGSQLLRLQTSQASGFSGFGKGVVLQGGLAVIGSNRAYQDSGAGYSYSLDSMGSNYCASLTNSTGSAALISACGSAALADQLLTLRAFPVPDNTFVFFAGTTQVQVPFGNGLRCAGGSVVRLNSPASASGQEAKLNADLSAAGIQMPGLYHLQCWYRDPAAGGAAFNLSDALSIALTP